MLDLNVLQLVMVLQKSLVLPWTDFQFMDQALIQPMAKSGAKMIWMIVDDANGNYGYYVTGMGRKTHC